MADSIIVEAKERYKEAIEASGDNHERAKEAIKFRNLEQWPDEVKRNRENDPDGARPTLVLDKINQFIRQITNDQRQNRPAIRVRPVDDFADIDTAKVFQGIVRHIEDRSNAEHAYDTAFEHAVDGGFGYWRIITDWCDEDSFEQEILIKRIRNRFSVTIDAACVEPDGSDMEYAFIAESLTEHEFENQFPGKSKIDWDFEKDKQSLWLNDDQVTIAEYYKIVSKTEKIVLLDDGSVLAKTDYEGGAEDAYVFALNEMGVIAPTENKKQVVRERETERKKIKWYKLNNQEILDEKDVLGKYIPVVQVLGNELDVEGDVYKTGVIRPAMDAQRMYNYASSAYVEQVALAPKSPYIAADGQVEDFEGEWADANRRNISTLRYKPISVDGVMVPPPIRQASPQVPTGWAAQLGNFEHDIQGAMGMYNPAIGADASEKSGKAIQLRQREGDTSTFHFIDNLSRSISHTGRILVDIIPQIYDTPRIARILGEDSQPDMVRIDPGQEMAKREKKDQEGHIETIYNLNVGKYDVTVSTGPSFTTKRQEAAEMMTQMVNGNPDMMRLIGDKMFMNMDWHGAEEVAERMKKLLPPELQDTEEGDQQVQQAMQIIEQMKGKMQEMAQGKEMRELKVKEEEVRIKGYEAETKRLEVEQKGSEEDINQLAEAVTILSGQVEQIMNLRVQ